jgi:hypothetical protein
MSLPRSATLAQRLNDSVRVAYADIPNRAVVFNCIIVEFQPLIIAFLYNRINVVCKT